MRKIKTIFKRDMSRQPALVTDEWVEECLWVRDGDGVPTGKVDGTCCMVREGVLYKRREVKSGKSVPADFELVEEDENTGKKFGWVPVGDGPEDQFHREAWGYMSGVILDGTYELVGPKIQGNKHVFPRHELVPHGVEILPDVKRTYADIRLFLEYVRTIEGIVWHHPDGRMAKIKARDFGLEW